ncbi:hypothetical protein HanIR_Chr01g0046751 [Helianthus annuus]|nr:hypothetical protein HanIR_Chr01g0046751 [Helianthus annuus]
MDQTWGPPDRCIISCSLEPLIGVLHATKFQLAESFHGCRYVRPI